jgi:hypothetical protein
MYYIFIEVVLELQISFGYFEEKWEYFTNPGVIGLYFSDAFFYPGLFH